MTEKKRIEVISRIADKILSHLKEWNMATREKWQIMMDFDLVNKICPLDFNMLLNNEETLLHDYAGICLHFNRQTRDWTEGSFFVPRSAIKE